MHALKIYPKIITLLTIYVVTFFVCSFLQHPIETLLVWLGPFGVFASGVLYTYAFTGSIGTAAITFINHTYSPLFIAIVGGVGAGLADISIFQFLKRYNINDEVEVLMRSKLFQRHIVNKFAFMRSRLILTLVGIVTIASPLPDELGVLCIERGGLVASRYLFVIGFIANMLGIYMVASVF